MKIKEIVKRVLPDIWIFRCQAIWKNATLLLWTDKKYISTRYKKIVGKKISFDNPKTFSEKLQIMKLFNRNPLLTQCTDKFKVREYLIDKGYGHLLIPLISVYNNADEINFDDLPNEFFMKCNHASGTNYYVEDKSVISEKYIRKLFNIYLSRNHYIMEREWNYKNISPRILIEKPIKDSYGNLPIDYKFFCFNGTPKVIMICTGVISKNGDKGVPECNFYDIDFNLIDLRINNNNIKNIIIKKPDNLDSMIEISKNLSSEFAFCRVDLFNVNNKVYFGELTFIHGAGLLRFDPKEYDIIFGDWLEYRQGEYE